MYILYQNLEQRPRLLASSQGGETIMLLNVPDKND